MKTKLEIIEETVAYYSEDVNRRASTEFGCYYHTEDGRNCAVARCLVNAQEVEDYVVTNCDGLASARTLHERLGEEKFQNLFKEDYKNHDYKFWQDLQVLHDNNFYWNEKGLSIDGTIEYEKLKTKYANS